MFSWVLPRSTYFYEAEHKPFLFSSDNTLFTPQTNKPSPLAAYRLPHGYQVMGQSDDERQCVLLEKETFLRGPREIFRYDLTSGSVEGPLFVLDKQRRFRGFAQNRAFLWNKKEKFTQIVSVTDRSVSASLGGVGGLLSVYKGGFLFRKLTPGQERITLVGNDGQQQWQFEPVNAREALLFEGLEIIVCSIWHEKTKGGYDRCELLFLNANTGETVDTVPLEGRLARREGQVVHEGQTIYARTTDALYAYDLMRRETRRFSIPEAVSTPAFLVANGKAYVGDNEDGNGRLYVISADDGGIIGSRLFEGLIFNEMASKVVRFGCGLAMNMENASETSGWKYARIVSWLDGEMEDPQAELYVEPLRAGIKRERVGRDSRYRVRLEAGCFLEEILRHMVVGLESAAHRAAISRFDDTKPYDEDFAGELIADLSNQQLSGEEWEVVSRSLGDFLHKKLGYYENAVDQGPVTMTVVYPS